MDTELTVELGAADPTLAVPWSGEDGRLRYHDLRRQPDLLLYIDEATRFPELADFLVRINSPASLLQSAKCDAWYSTEISAPEEIYGAGGKFVSYIDVFFAAESPRFSFDHHEQFAGRLIKLLGRAPQISAAAEFIIRRCYYGDSALDKQTSAPSHDGGKAAAEYREGFYLTFYLSGYGDDETDARKRWGIALKLIGNAILQLSVARAAD